MEGNTEGLRGSKDTDMAKWLECDRTVLLGLALDPIKLPRSRLSAYAFLEQPWRWRSTWTNASYRYAIVSVRVLRKACRQTFESRPDSPLTRSRSGCGDANPGETQQDQDTDRRRIPRRHERQRRTPHWT